MIVFSFLFFLIDFLLHNISIDIASPLYFLYFFYFLKCFIAMLYNNTYTIESILNIHPRIHKLLFFKQKALPYWSPLRGNLFVFHLCLSWNTWDDWFARLQYNVTDVIVRCLFACFSEIATIDMSITSDVNGMLSPTNQQYIRIHIQGLYSDLVEHL